MSQSGLKKATFCYRCGRRVSKQLDLCWYCGAPTERWIRQPKRCPFCGEEVRPEAVKCRHCGEFIDGRARQPEPPPPQQIIFVVDRQLLQGRSDLQLLAGRPVPPDVARQLDAQTVRAIETGQPKLLAQPGVRALPAPATDEAVSDAEPVDDGDSMVRDIVPLKSGGGGVARRGAEPSGNLPALRGREENQNLPALSERLAPAVRDTAFGVGKALIKAGGWLARRMFTSPPPPPDDGVMDAQPRDLYQICERCQTEILTKDNFCYHCGMKYHSPAADIKALAPVIMPDKRLNMGQFLLTIALLTACGVLKKMPDLVPGYGSIVAWVAGGLAVSLSIYGVMRGRGFRNKIFSLILGVLAGLVLRLL